jgi:hypothetical protein
MFQFKHDDTENRLFLTGGRRWTAFKEGVIEVSDLQYDF